MDISLIDWSHVLEAFIGAAFAFLFGLILQCFIVWWQHRFQKKMQKDQQRFQERMEHNRQIEETSKGALAKHLFTQHDDSDSK